MTSHNTLNTRGADVALSVEKVLTKLTVCLNQETEAVLQNNQAALRTLQEEKMRLMEQYRSLSETLEHDTSILSQLDDNIQKHLKKISNEFQKALKDNLQAIKSAHNSVTRLMDRILSTARRTLLQDQQQYNAKGALTGGVVNGSMMPTKINQEL